MAVGVDKLLQLLFVFHVAKSVAPFVKHRMAWLPAMFVTLGITVDFVVIFWLFFVAGDKTVEVYQQTSKAAFDRMDLANSSDLSGMRAHRFPVVHEVVCRAVLTHTSILAASVFCLCVWGMHGIERAYGLYVLPMLLDLKVVETHVWKNFDDWSALDVGEQAKVT